MPGRISRYRPSPVVTVLHPAIIVLLASRLFSGEPVSRGADAVDGLASSPVPILPVLRDGESEPLCLPNPGRKGSAAAGRLSVSAFLSVETAPSAMVAAASEGPEIASSRTRTMLIRGRNGARPPPLRPQR